MLKKMLFSSVALSLLAISFSGTVSTFANEIDAQDRESAILTSTKLFSSNINDYRARVVQVVNRYQETITPGEETLITNLDTIELTYTTSFRKGTPIIISATSVGNTTITVYQNVWYTE